MSGPSRATRHDVTINKAGAGGERSVSWAEFREICGKNKDRATALQLISSATGYVPLPHQLRFHLSPARNRLLVSGVGAGKTLASVVQMMLALVLNPGCSAAFVSPTFDSVQNIILPEWLRLCDGMARMGTPIMTKYHRSMAKADLVGGGMLLFRSFDRVDNLRGFTFCAVNIDESEVSMNPEYVFRTLSDRVRDPSAHVHEVNVTTTPKGLRGVPRMFVERRSTPHKSEWWAGRATSMQNPHLPDTFIDSLKQGHSTRSYEQEVMGRILRPSHVVFPEVSREMHSIPWTYDPSLPYVMACDFGYSHPYYGFAQMLPDGRAVIFDEWCEDEVPETQQKQWVIDKCRSLGKEPEHITGDRAVKEMLAWMMHQFPSARVHRMRTRKEQQIVAGLEAMRALFDPLEEAPKLLISDRLWDSKKERGICKSLGMYRWKVNREGLITDTPYKDNLSDHSIDSWRYAVRAVLSSQDRTAAFVLGSKDHVDYFAKKQRNSRR